MIEDYTGKEKRIQRNKIHIELKVKKINLK